MLSHTRSDVAQLNVLARDRQRATGGLGEDHVVETDQGARRFARGDRVMFLRNERSLGVKNGTLGTLEAIGRTELWVRLDGSEGRQIRFELKDYAHIDYGYAATIHKSQGVTVDHAHLLASAGLDRHATYVAMSRHRESLAVHYSLVDFATPDALARQLSRERAKDTTLDYGEVFAARRGIVSQSAQISPLRADRRFSGFKPRLGAPPLPFAPPKPMLGEAARSYANAVADAMRMRDANLPVLPHQLLALKRAAQTLSRADPQAARDLRAVFSRRPDLARRITDAAGEMALHAALADEAALRRDPLARADRFVEHWTELEARRADQHRQGGGGQGRFEDQLRELAKDLAKDAPMMAALEARRGDLGLPASPGGRDLAQDLARLVGQLRGPDLGR
jgi:hypothetical protein